MRCRRELGGTRISSTRVVGKILPTAVRENALLVGGVETAFRAVLLVVRDALPVEPLVVFSVAMDLVTEALRELSRVHALEVVVTLIVVMISLIVLTPLLSRWLGTSTAVLGLTPVPDRLLTIALLDFAGSRHGGRVDHGLRLL